MLRDDLFALFPALRGLDASAFVVGGAIRDLLRGEMPADADVACPDPLACARSLGRKVIRLGNEHLSAWRVVAPPHVYDFAEVLDGDIGADLARRDFTINAMAVPLATGELLDPHGGRRDLEQRLVRMVEASNFDDDPLRLLKGVRMAVRLRFEIEPVTIAAMRERALSITSVARERVTYELSLIFTAGTFRAAVGLLHATALDGPLFGRALDPASFHSDDVPPAAAYALLVPDPAAYAKRWRWSTLLLREVLTIQELLRSSGDLRIALYDAGEQTAHDYAAALRALGRGASIPMPDFAIRPLLGGNEIASLTGIEPGPELGRVKRALLEAQILGRVRARDEAERFVLGS